MKYTLSFKEGDYHDLTTYLFPDRTRERAAYLLCGFSVTDTESRLLVNEVVYVDEKDVEDFSETHIKIKSPSYVKVIKRARDNNQSLVFVHSHLSEHLLHSSQDDKEEVGFFETVYKRVDNVPIHGSLVLSDINKPRGRIWHQDGSTSPISVVRVIGKRFFFYYNQDTSANVDYFDRHIRALSEEVQKSLQRITVGVVGLGGTGSAVIEQLVRLGIGNLYIFDPDTFDVTNINRVYGSRVTDHGSKKVDITDRHIKEIGLPTTVQKFDSSISNEETAKMLRNCDVIFGCTDDHYGRVILSRVATYYHIPLIDVGVSVDSIEEIISSIQGRISVVTSVDPCLLCTAVVNPKMVESEVAEISDSQEARKRRSEGYLAELPGTAPSVIPFTSTVASGAIIELLHRMAGILKEPRLGSHVVHRFDHTDVKPLPKKSVEGCICGNKVFQGKGDTDQFLGLTW